MKFYKNKKFIFIIMMFVVIAGLIAYKYISSKAMPADGYARPVMNYDEILSCKGSSAEDDAVVTKIITNLPANKLYEKSSSSTEDGKIIINIYYSDFKEVDIEIFDNVFMSRKYSEVFAPNVTVLFALLNDVDIIKVHRGDSKVYEYTRNEAKHSYADGNLDEITQSAAKLGRIYDIWVG